MDLSVGEASVQNQCWKAEGQFAGEIESKAQEEDKGSSE